MADDKKKIKHHGFAHFLLAVVLFLLAVEVFGGWTQGPLTSGLFLGVKAYQLAAGASAGNIEAASLAGASVLQLALIFVANLAIYYIAASVIIFLFNLVFSGKEKEK